MSHQESPNVVIVGGPNGSGKSTAAPALLRDYLGITQFVNADVIAQGLSGFGSENVALYRPVVDTWRLFDNSRSEGYELIAHESSEESLHVENEVIWQTLVEIYQ